MKKHKPLPNHFRAIRNSQLYTNLRSFVESDAFDVLTNKLREPIEDQTEISSDLQSFMCEQ